MAGRTGIDGFDDWAQELVDFGYLHNHARMWFASIWIFTLHLPWQLGADFFMRHLLDGDPASNTLSWRWVAGLQTVGKTYLATAQNIDFATEGRFRPRGLATQAIALEDDAPMPAPLGAPQAQRVPAGRAALLVHDDDLHAESFEGALSAAGVEVVAVASARGGQPRSPLNSPDRAAPLVAGFTADALTDGRERAGVHYGAPVHALDTLTASDLLPWLQAHSVSSIVTPYAPVGPVRDSLDRLAADLAGEGVSVSRLLRPWDSQAWPHAARGFFPFREKIAFLLREQNIGSDR
jgi:hypothetical protein